MRDAYSAHERNGCSRSRASVSRDTSFCSKGEEEVMLRIVVLDDEMCWIETMKQITEGFFSQEEYEFFSYTNAEEFLFDMEEKRDYDIVLLDMEIPGTSGLEVGRKLRLGHPESTIVFVTNHVEYAVQAYEVNAFRYIPKCMLKEKLPEAYAYIVEKLKMREKRFFLISNNEKMGRIEEDLIYYLEKEKKYVRVVHRDGEDKVRMTLAEAYDRLTAADFVQIDRSCIAGLRHIMAVEKHKVRLRNGVYLDISQPQYAYVRKQISEYWSKK